MPNPGKESNKIEEALEGGSSSSQEPVAGDSGSSSSQVKTGGNLSDVLEDNLQVSTFEKPGKSKKIF